MTDDLPPISDQIERQHRAIMNDISRHLSDIFHDYGFALLIFDWGDKGRLNWISNANRADMVAALRECAATLEGGGGHGAPKEKQ